MTEALYFKSLAELMAILYHSQGLSYYGCQGCLAPAEFLDSNVWHPLILAILLHNVVLHP